MQSGLWKFIRDYAVSVKSRRQQQLGQKGKGLFCYGLVDQRCPQQQVFWHFHLQQKE